MKDAFSHFAPYYDAVMQDIDYDRWLVLTTTLADLLPSQEFRHLDIACGTGTHSARLLQHGWNTTGVDLSPAMLRERPCGRFAFPVAAADMRALPFDGAFDYATCLFDSLNFVLEEDGIQEAIASFADSLHTGGLLYFDAITERMVVEHFAGSEWSEDHRTFATQWSGDYDRKTGLAETTIEVVNGPIMIVRERVYPSPFIEQAVRDAGLTLLGAFDARTWRAPGKKTLRIDYVAMKRPPRGSKRKFSALQRRVRSMLE